MFAKFSVKKPLTVFVSVFMVIILGFVAFTSMTPDLLPGINLPYAVVITTYPGATPEEIEEQVSKPMEQSMASLENINSISSTSDENVSIIMLEFNESANMDTMVGEIREKINGVSGYWNDMVQTPFIMKINPNLLPVNVASVEYNGLTNIEVTRFVQDEILSELEGITGVASVDISGNVTEQVNVLLSQEKINLLNQKLKYAIEGEFEEGETEIADGLKQVIDGQNEINSQSSQLSSAENLLSSSLKDIEAQTSQAKADLIAKKSEADAGIIALTEQLVTLKEGLPILETANTNLVELNKGYNNALTQISELEVNLVRYNEVLTALNSSQPTPHPDLPSTVPEVQALIDSAENEKNQLEIAADGY